MKVQIVKYLNSRGKVIEMRKDNFKGRDLPENIIEEYDVEIKDKDSNEIDKLEDLKRKYATGNYILLWKGGRDVFGPPKWQICCDFGLYQFYNFKLIHTRHKDTLKAYLKNPSVEIECTNNISKDADIETIWHLEEDFIENYDENIYYRLKVKDLAWYEEKDNFRIAVKQIKSLNDYTEKDGKMYIMEKVTDTKGVSNYYTDGYHTPLQWLDCYRPASEDEVLSLIYKPQQKVSKETASAESNRLKDLFLNDLAECLVEDEKEFRLVYDFLDKTCDEELYRFLGDDGNLDYDALNDKFPIVIFTSRKWGSVYEYNLLQYRDKNKPLIKFNGKKFWEVFE